MHGSSGSRSSVPDKPSAEAIASKHAVQMTAIQHASIPVVSVEISPNMDMRLSHPAEAPHSEPKHSLGCPIRHVLHVGSGIAASKKLQLVFEKPQCERIWLDIAPRVKPYLLGSTLGLEPLLSFG
jgi:hypothetical protein